MEGIARFPSIRFSLQRKKNNKQRGEPHTKKGREIMKSEYIFCFSIIFMEFVLVVTNFIKDLSGICFFQPISVSVKAALAFDAGIALIVLVQALVVYACYVNETYED